MTISEGRFEGMSDAEIARALQSEGYNQAQVSDHLAGKQVDKVTTVVIKDETSGRIPEERFVEDMPDVLVGGHAAVELD